MQVCSEHHDEIVFDGRRCPLCEANSEIDTMKDQIDELERTIDARDAAIEELTQDNLQLADEAAKGTER